MPDANEDTPLDDELREQVHESGSVLLNRVLVVLGSIFVGLGLVGVVMPVVPTTPFLLVAAACYARSSERFYVWLLTNRFFGQYLRDWRENKGLSLPVKLWIVFVLAATMGLSIYFVPLNYVRAVLALIGVCISVYIFRLPTKPAEPTENERS